MNTRPLNFAVIAVIAFGGALLGFSQKQDSNLLRWVPSGDYDRRDRISIRPKIGFVPDASTALAIGRILLKKHLPAQEYRSIEPLGALERPGYWIVYGNLTYPKGTEVTGGTAILEIDRNSGTVLRFTRGR